MNWKFWKPKLTREQIEQEIKALREAYVKSPYGGLGFLVGSSLIGNKQGDSARYWELKKMLDKLDIKRN